MDTTIIDGLLASNSEGSSAFVKRDAHNQRMIQNLHRAVEVFTAAVASKEIYNVEYKDHYQDISRAVEEAFDCHSHQHIEEFRAERQSWDATDPRMYLWYHPSFANVGGALKKLAKKFEGKDKQVDSFLPILREAVALLELCKSVKPFIKKGRRPNVNKTEAMIAEENFNTGVCAICANRQKLEHGAEVLVMHGYQMSDYNHAGYRVGKCFGVGYKPYELSNEANIAFAPVLEDHRRGIANAIKTWKSGKITEVQVTREGKWNGRGYDKIELTFTLEANPVEFKQEVEHRIDRLEYELSMVKADIKTNNAKINDWTLQPLKYGSEAAAN